MNFLRTGLLIFTLFILSVKLYSQEAPPPTEPGMPSDVLAQIHSESEMSKDVNILRDIYHKEVEIYVLPNELVAKGMDAAINYWTELYKKQDNISVELMEIIPADNLVAYKAKRGEPSSKQTMMIIRLIEVKDGKIFRLYL